MTTLEDYSKVKLKFNNHLLAKIRKFFYKAHTFLHTVSKVFKKPSLFDQSDKIIVSISTIFRELVRFLFKL